MKRALEIVLSAALLSLSACGTTSASTGTDGGGVLVLEDGGFVLQDGGVVDDTDPPTSADGGTPATCAETHCSNGYQCCQLCMRVSCFPKQYSCPRVECNGP